MPAIPIAAQKRSDRRRNQADQQRNQSRQGNRHIKILRHGIQGCRHQQKTERQTSQRNSKGKLIRRFLADGTFDQRNHAVHKRLAGSGSDLHRNPVGKNAGSSSYPGTVAAGFTHDRRGFSG